VRLERVKTHQPIEAGRRGGIVVSKKQYSLTAQVGQLSQVQLAVRRAVRQRGPVLAVGALSLIAATSSLPALAADSAAAADSNTSDSSKSDDKLSEVVVTGQREALQSAQRFKEVSMQIVDSVIAADIGKLPDRSVTEVLQRIPGITIDHTYRDIAGHTDPEHFQVEGSGVAIRGLSYVRSEVNGRDVFTANGGRQLSFDDVPPELLAAIDVYKNPDASQIEGGVGGVVNLRTAKPFDFTGARIGASAGGSWGDLSRGNLKPSASLLLSDRWQTGIGSFGLLADVAYSESLNRTDGIERFAYFPRVSGLEAPNDNNGWIPAGQTVWVPNGGVSWRTLRYKRKREGLYLALQWSPADNVETSITWFDSVYQFHWDENAIFAATSPYNIAPAPGTSFTYTPNGMLAKGIITDPSDNGLPFNDDTRSADRHSNTSDVSWNLIWHATERLKLTTDVQLVRSNTNSDDFTVATGVNVPSESIDLTGKLPVVSVPQAYLTNPANYYWAFTMDGLSLAHGKEWSWREDAEYKLGDGFFKSIRAGVRMADRSAQTDLSEPGNGYNWQAVSQTWMLGWNLPNLAYLNKFPAATNTYAFPNFFNGRVPLPSAVVFPAVSVATGWPNSFATIQGFRTTLCQQLDPSCNYSWTPASLIQAPGAPPTGGLNTQDERTFAGYLTVPFGSNIGELPFDGEIGVRVVHTRDSANGYLTLSQFSIPTNVPTGGQYFAFSTLAQAQSAKNSYTDVLPSLNMRFHWADRLQSHLALAEAMARPDFSQLQAFTSLGSAVDSGSGVQSFTGTSSGNPRLKPTKSFQIDGTLEWYFAPTGSVTADVFYKHLTDVVINQVFPVTGFDTNGGAHTFTTTGPVNGASGKIKGIEVAYQQYYDFLPNLLRGFGTQLNFTYVDSSQTLNTPVTGKYCDSSSGGADNLNLNLNGCDTNGTTFGNLPLLGLSKYAYNAALLYDRGPISARLAYSWRSKYLMGVNVNAANGTNGLNTDPSSANYGQMNNAWGLPLYADKYGELDASIFYKINEHITLGLTALNLTDAQYKELQQQHIATTELAWYDSGRTYSAQVRVTF